MHSMEKWLKIDKEVSELVSNWRWEEPINHDDRYDAKCSDNYDPKYYSYSYSEWRKRRSYYKTQTDEYYKDFIGTLMPLRHGDHPNLHPNQQSQSAIYSAISLCVSQHIPSTHLLVGLLYSSYHLVSPYILPTLKHVLTVYKDDINFSVTSISNPRYSVAHIAAMTNDIELLQILYDLGGNIDVIDGSNFSPFYIALGKRNFKVAHTLLWMNTTVQSQQITKKISNFGLRHLMNVAALFQHFLFEIDLYINAITLTLKQKEYINNDIIQSIVMFFLPMQSYQTIKRVLKKMENDEIYASKIPFEFVMEEANKCLSALIVLKKELLLTTDHLYPFGPIIDIQNNKRFVNKMTLCNLFELSMVDGDLYSIAKWRKQIEKVLCKPKKISLFHQHRNLENEEKIRVLKWMLVGAVITTITAILIKRIAKKYKQ